MNLLSKCLIILAVVILILGMLNKNRLSVLKMIIASLVNDNRIIFFINLTIESFRTMKENAKKIDSCIF